MLISSDKFKPRSYVGYTNDIARRLLKHNNNKGAKFTKGNQWKVIYKKRFSKKSEAMSYEYKLKNDRKMRNNIKFKYIDAQI